MMDRTKRRKNKIYFTKQTEEAIVAYIQSNSYAERNVLYREYIDFPFNKIAENMINRYSFPYFEQSTENLQLEVVAYMISKIEKYDTTKGAAFSYFSVIARNYLVAGNKESYSRIKQHYRLDDPDATVNQIIDEESYVQMNSDSNEFFTLMLEYWENNLDILFTKPQDIQVADAILELFRRSQNIENFNKKHLYVLIREQTNMSTSYITSVVNKMKKIINQLLNEYSHDGIFDTSRKE